ncbi:MAG: hypothetical protein V4707_13830 [Pseudomonadota bacterium]
MDPGQRTRLEALKSQALSRRKRAEEGSYLRPILSSLRQASIRCRRLSPARVKAALGTLADGPGQDERLLWSAIPHGVCHAWTGEDERTALIRRALDACCDSQSRVAVVWHPAFAGLRLRADDLARHAALIFDGSPEIWMCDAAGGGWLIEIARFDTEVCWFRAA